MTINTSDGLQINNHLSPANFFCITNRRTNFFDFFFHSCFICIFSSLNVAKDLLLKWSCFFFFLYTHFFDLIIFEMSPGTLVRPSHSTYVSLYSVTFPIVPQSLDSCAWPIIHKYPLFPSPLISAPITRPFSPRTSLTNVNYYCFCFWTRPVFYNKQIN